MWWSVFKRSWFCCRLPRLDFCLHKCWSLKCPLHVLFNVFVFFLSFILLQEKHGIVLLAWCLFCPWNAQIAVKVNKYSLSMRNVSTQMQFLFWFTKTEKQKQAAAAVSSNGRWWRIKKPTYCTASYRGEEADNLTFEMKRWNYRLLLLTWLCTRHHHHDHFKRNTVYFGVTG